MPLLAGPPVSFAGRRFYDAGVSESVPYRTALAQGATHILVLRSRRDPLTWPDDRAPSRSVRLITRTTLRRETPALRATFLSRDARLAADDRRLAAYQSQSQSCADETPAVFSIRPAPGSPEVSRLATDGRLLAAAFSSGRAAARAALTPP
jgi:predicted patatin/cPLA2 family phospholipase